MARTRRPWSELRDDIRRLINDDGDTEYFSDADLQALFNEVKDHREMQLFDQHEQWGEAIYNADIVAGQREYELPEECARIKRVFVVDGDVKHVVQQDRQFAGTYLQEDVQSSGNLFSYRLIDGHVYLYPTPSESVTAGLQIEMEVATDRIDNDADKIPDSWPPFAETLLVLDAAIAALEQQATSEGDLGSSQLTWLERRRARYEETWFDYTASRTTSLIFGLRWNQGA